MKFSNQESSEIRIKNGVPHGSKLGALMFILYINNIPMLKYCKIHMLADDTYQA